VLFPTSVIALPLPKCFTTERSRGGVVYDKESNHFPTHPADYFQKSESGVSGSLFSDKALSNKLITILVSIVQ